jgi:hypothetical protein
MRKIFLILFFFACEKNELIMKINNRKIESKYLFYKIAIERARGIEVGDTIGNLINIINEVLNEEILKEEGFLITEEMISIEKERIERETQLPEVLAKIKKVFEKEEDYLNYFVKPNLCERALQVKFYLDTIYHLEDYNFMKAVLKKLEKKESLNMESFLYQPKRESIDYYKKIYPEGKVLQDFSSFFVVKWEGDKIRFYRRFKKGNFYDWWRKKAIKYRVKVYNKRYLELLIKKVEGDTFYLTLLSKR